MATKQEIIEWLRNNPGSSSNEVAKALGLKDSSGAAVRLNTIYKQGLISRVEGRTAANVKFYSYTVVDGSLPNEGVGTREGTAHTREGMGSTRERVGSTSLDTALDALARSVAAQFVEKVKAHMADGLANVLPGLQIPTAQVPELPSAAPSSDEVRSRRSVAALPKPALPKVLVTGLLPQQAGMIQAEFGDCFDVRFWNNRAGDGMDSLRSQCRSVDAVFWHTAHSAHTYEEIVKSSGVKLIRVSGGMTNMRDKLTDFYCERRES